MLISKNKNIDNWNIAKLSRFTGQYIEKPTNLIFLNEKEFADITGQKLSTVRSNRIKGIGCNFYKIGGSVRYKLSEVIDYIESCKCSSTTKKNANCG